MDNTFFAWLSRLSLIRRWGLMHPSSPENDAEHSLQAAFIAHGIAIIAREQFGADINPEHVTVLAVYHDASEVFTGDMPTPVKYSNPIIRDAYHEMEYNACRRLQQTLPENLQQAWSPYLFADESTREWQIVKAADKISAWSHCLEELKLGNREFEQAAVKIRESIDAINLPEVQEFMRLFAPSFSMTLDELGGVQ